MRWSWIQGKDGNISPRLHTATAAKLCKQYSKQLFFTLQVASDTVAINVSLSYMTEKGLLFVFENGPIVCCVACILFRVT